MGCVEDEEGKEERMAVAVMVMIEILQIVICQMTFICDWSFITQYF
jgi:hypothetical protein